MKKLKISSEFTYIAAILLLSLSVAMITTTGFGVSMIVAPAYILSLKLGITFGQGEYIIQAVLFVVFCILMKKVKLVYFSSFLTGVIYGAVLDLWRTVIPHFNPNITPVGSLPLWLRLIYFVLGMLMTSFSVALFFRTYFYPQVYDFFVKGVSGKYSFHREKFKTCFDASCLLAAVIMTLLMFHGFKGIGVGTLIMTAFNGLIISFFGKIQDKFLDISPRFKKLSQYFSID